MDFNFKQVKIFYFSQFIWDRNNKDLAFGEIIGPVNSVHTIAKRKKEVGSKDNTI